ncbi:alpha-1,4-glucan--maltose-1-phosphate maltosyltransferase [Pandoraea nosoerga]|uniref:Alpha-1,4-glucan:maltose-1-phosphate maltosyltransferase n=1 Tax=Pandoraea nosoerga TaxID=2508296 RepID=A0A5E4SS36_9BURK|nr:alpha-1,4-glucan--maltose-1-phosphate maltosyltransferase [Pandoraea nosoerga]MBN4674598.1 alpha-1,4-glucan--maltose-1-phosphate maltosyltransferase [Pandoraea nosoerga]MBN4680486.1 alpha-1,4-glucan--maltose-1-phosphate maltosyltransferase [Pandoraea nosoerga]MBN4743891.1 alpha-1,4-glucan--maltose-1-phosphate maltosyltransferase [Pandoraea nosoerga]VVD77178.1 maltose alpha-D-glucosyltransferase [Pandoraea nosoerga]
MSNLPSRQGATADVPAAMTDIAVGMGPPRIYALMASPLPAPHAWAALVESVASLGFSRLLIDETTCDDKLPEYLRATRRHGIALDVAISADVGAASFRAAQGAEGAEAGASTDDDAPPDPRRLQSASNLAHPTRPAGSPLSAPQANATARSQTRSPSSDPLAARLHCLAAQGVNGFCLHHLDVRPAAAWHRLLGDMRRHYPALQWFGWTPGLSREQMSAVASAGFDGVFLSSCWWDMRASWLYDEHADLAKCAWRIALAGDPFDTSGDIVARSHNVLECARALQLAFELGDGILMPAGMEFGHAHAAREVPGVAPPNAADSGAPAQEIDFRQTVRAGNRRLAQTARRASPAKTPAHELPVAPAVLRCLSGADAAVTVLTQQVPNAKDSRIVAVNRSLTRAASLPVSACANGGHVRFTPLDSQGNPTGEPETLSHITLAPGEVRIWHATLDRSVSRHAWPKARYGAASEQDRRAVRDAAAHSRVVIEDVVPSLENGRFVARAVVGENVPVYADVFTDGHAHPSAVLRWRALDSNTWREAPMVPIGNDRWRGEFRPTRLGRYEYLVEAWRDPYVNWCIEVAKKRDAGQPVALEIREGVECLREIAAQACVAKHRKTLETIAKQGESQDPTIAYATLSAPATLEAVAAVRHRPFAARSPALALDAEPPEAGYASWYELFPRSQSGDVNRHGTFDDVIRRLPAIAEMGFDVLYMPPIHPIGRTHRKGRNNRLDAQPTDPGSPYAIGDETGGHDAIHPELGTIDDFRRLRDAAHAQGLRIALDFAVQCSPDHPWLREHPGWFDWRADGSLRYAENPPKKYEDIVNVDFYAPDAVPALWLALRDIVLFWIGEGIEFFRVDNPHTKPLPFWEWLIGSVRAAHPRAVFLAEAFTRPKLMYRLAKIGFSQSYTYFTWRETKGEITDYLMELQRPEIAACFRPHFFVNTPDINPYHLQRGGRPVHLARAALAATLSGLWGMYSGFELCEATPLPGREEYLDAEKYEIRAWDWDRPGNIVREITVLNRIRRGHPALQTHRGVTFLNAGDPHVLYFEKATPTRSDVVLVAINLDAGQVHDAPIELPLWRWQLPDDAALEAENLLDGTQFVWRGKHQHVHLPPHAPYGIWAVRPWREHPDSGETP